MERSFFFVAHMCVWWELLVRLVGRNSSLAIPLWHAVLVRNCSPAYSNGMILLVGRRLREVSGFGDYVTTSVHIYVRTSTLLSRNREPAPLNRYVESRKQHPEQSALYLSSEYPEAETAETSNQFVEA